MNSAHDAGQIDRLADELLSATDAATPVPPLTERYPSLDIDDAYGIQSRQRTMRRAAGRSLVGRKIGLTSLAMQQQLGIDSPDFGYVLDDMVYSDGDTVPAARFISPRVEPELAFVLDRPLRGPGLTRSDALAAVGEVFLALEIIDSRVADWKITLVDTVADNASCGAVVLAREPLEIDPGQTADMVVDLSRNGQVVHRGNGAAVMSDPLEPLVWLANTLAAYDEGLEAGEFVLTGSFTGAVAVAVGDDITAHFGEHGAIGIRFGEESR